MRCVGVHIVGWHRTGARSWGNVISMLIRYFPSLVVIIFVML